MKVLFVGVGLTDYGNQILNSLQKKLGIEIYDLVDQGGKGFGDAVHQTKDGVKFKVIYSKELTHNILSEFKYKSFKNFNKIVENLKPEIMVITENYLPYILKNSKTKKIIEELQIKVIMKDIPFRLEKYGDLKEKIIKGEKEKTFVPIFFTYLVTISNKLKIGRVLNSLKRISKKISINNLYRKLFAKKILLKKLEQKKILLNFPDAHVDYVEEAYEIFGSYGVPKEKIFIIYNSPDTDHLFEVRKKIENSPSMLPYSNHRIIHIGRLVEWKRVDMLIRAFKKVKSEFKDAELLIIGTGPQENILKRLAKDLRTEDSIKFLGGIYKPEEIGKYLLASTAYVLAGMGGISINDAMIFGKPIICSVCDGTEKKLVYHGRNGLYFKDGDESSLIDSIKRLFKDQELVKKMGEESTNIVKNEINIDTVVSGYNKAFNYVLKK